MGKRKIMLLAAAAAAVLAVVVLVCLLLPREGPPGEGKGLTVLDSRGNVLITAQRESQLYESEYWAYLEIVCREVLELVAQQENCSTDQARQTLFTRGYQVHTAFDADAYQALKNAGIVWADTCPTAGVITDLQGNLLAVNSTDPANTQRNYAWERRAPCSAFKTLSVYTPAVEKGIINWATQYEDSPYKQLTEGGQLRDWPANASGKYSLEAVPVSEALCKSLNTVAVKCLKDVGVTASIEFLQKSFDIPLKEEAHVAKTYGEEEVIGSIALGYLETGITPVEMAGYYQIFANGGVYTPVRAVTKLLAEDGTVLYLRKAAPRQVISPATADTMNKLLQGVAAPGGTGEKAHCGQIQVAGKTGTGDNYEDNWFVGVTPEYSLAMWHGENEGNEASQMFAAVVQGLYNAKPDAGKQFVTHKNLYQIAYCVHSGKAFSPGCTQIEVGYFTSKDALPVCDSCK